MPELVMRLHITPLDPDLLSIILGRRLIPLATNVSYHKIQTAPERDFGYVDLPAMDADKLKKQLNGAILKGKKIKVEEARPVKRRRTDVDDAEQVAHARTGDCLTPTELAELPKLPKRSRRGDDTLSAHELSPDRKVKRGWTEPKSQTRRAGKIQKDGTDKSSRSAKSQAPSKYTEGEELLFRTRVPPNKLVDEVKKKRDKKSKRKGTGEADVVHEFEKTTVVPSFLRDTAAGTRPSAVEYRDGQGWVDADGHVVEQESVNASRRRQVAKRGLEIDVIRAQSLHRTRPHNAPPSPPPSKPASTLTSASSTAVTGPVDDTSSEGTSSPSSSSSSSSGSESEDELDVQAKVDPVSESANELDGQHETGSEPLLENDEAATQESVHPLEALFKKPHLPLNTTSISTNQPTSQPASASSGSGKPKPALELTTTFSFFGNADDEEDDDHERREVHNQPTPHDNDISHLLPPMPMTPFSSQDLRVRRIRSAAPTPDTADIRKSTGYGSLILGEDDPDDVLSDGEDDGGKATGASQSKVPGNTQSHTLAPSSLGLPQSEFEKRFWETRGENNRAWKARRRTVLKENRQRENRTRRPRTF